MAQLASASGLGPEGPVFESQYPDKEREVYASLFLSGYAGSPHVMFTKLSFILLQFRLQHTSIAYSEDIFPVLSGGLPKDYNRNILLRPVL